MQEEQTPLHIASRLGKTEIVQLLLQHMAHPDAATTNGHTPLHISAREGQVDVASVLLEAGAAHSLATKVRGGLMTPGGGETEAGPLPRSAAEAAERRPGSGLWLLSLGAFSVRALDGQRDRESPRPVSGRGAALVPD